MYTLPSRMTQSADRRSFSPRRRLRRRVFLFSVLSGIAALLVGVIAFVMANVYLPLGRLTETNRATMQRVRCDMETCDMSEVNADPELSDVDYILDLRTYYFLGFPTIGIPGFPLGYADATFLERFDSPASFTAPDGESWRMLSKVCEVGAARLAVMVGYAERAPWKMDLPTNTAAVDAALAKELHRIAGGLRRADDRVELEMSARRRIAADGYVVVDRATNKVLYNGYSMPVYFPRSRPVPGGGSSAFVRGGQLYVVRGDTDGRLLVVNTERVGAVAPLLGLAALLAIGGGLVAYRTGMTFLRRYFVLTSSTASTCTDALRLGEGLTVEFKRGISFDVQNSVDRILETIAAFANTADGTLFIGVEDSGHVHGLKFDGPKGRNALADRLHLAVRQRIRPFPVIQIDFEDVEGRTVCRVFVPRGEDLLYVLDGVIYIRDGAADIKAPPERVCKLVEEYAV